MAYFISHSTQLLLPTCDPEHFPPKFGFGVSKDGWFWISLLLHIEKSENDERDISECSKCERNYILWFPAVAAYGAVNNCYCYARRLLVMLLTTATLACGGLKQGFHSQLEIEVLPQAGKHWILTTRPVARYKVLDFWLYRKEFPQRQRVVK